MFNIILIDTNSEYDNIICISKNFDNLDINYYAVSYKWGEHHQWRIKTDFYIASITSFSKKNLIKLCKKYKGIISYLWIDAICINQTNYKQRKETIYHMDDIYKRSKKIIAIPDLCYCEQNSRMEYISENDIISAVYEINCSEKFFASQKDPWTLSYENMIEYERVRSIKGCIYINDVVKEWAQRSWVISERFIGIKEKKLEIILLKSEVTIPYLEWKVFLNIDWDIIFDQYNIIRSIINSKSTKFIDRLFAILPHTKYKNILNTFNEQKIQINNLIELKIKLLDILDIEGKLIMLEDQFALENKDVRYFLPSFFKDEEFLIPSISYIYMQYFSTIEVINNNLKIVGKYKKLLYNLAYPNSIKMLNILTDSKKFSTIEIIVAKRKIVNEDDEEYFIIRCIGANNKWIVDSIFTNDVYDLTECNNGEFLVF